MSDEKEDIKNFVERLDETIDEFENHPKLQNYFLGVLPQLKNLSIAIRTDFDLH